MVKLHLFYTTGAWDLPIPILQIDKMEVTKSNFKIGYNKK
jgi:hypothetical protein